MQEMVDRRLAPMSFGEDPASLRAAEVQPPLPQMRGSNGAVGPVTALHACPFTDVLVCGHSDGRASLWHMPGTPATNASAAPTPVPQSTLVFQAHRSGAVAALATSPWGAVWTGSTQGSLRIFPDACAQARAAEQPAAAPAMVTGVEARRSVGERAHGRIAFLTLCASGQVRLCVRSSSRTVFSLSICTRALVHGVQQACMLCCRFNTKLQAIR